MLRSDFPMVRRSQSLKGHLRVTESLVMVTFSNSGRVRLSRVAMIVRLRSWMNVIRAGLFLNSLLFKMFSSLSRTALRTNCSGEFFVKTEDAFSA